MRRTIATVLATAGVVGAVFTGSAAASATSIAENNDIVGVDVNGDALTDLALTGVNGWTTVPVARSDGGGTFTVTNHGVGPFGGWASTPGVQILPGDYNGDGRSDFALTGVDGWTTVPVAFTAANGTYNVTNMPIPNFADWAVTPGAKVLTGDFNGDGRTDLAVTGPAGWGTLPLAFSDGDGSFTQTNLPIANFASWTSTPGVQILPGDYNGDGKTDVALTGVNGWTTVPVAMSNGNGTFSVTNTGVVNFPIWSATAGVKILPGDYNGDGKTDLALTGVNGWTTVPVASSDGDGSFSVTNKNVGGVPEWSTAAGAKVLTGDFNGDSRTDLVVTGVAGWSTVPVGFSTGGGSFTVTNQPVRGFPEWSAAAGATVVSGDFNGDGESDLAVTGASGWNTIPVAFSTGFGSFVVTNNAVNNFGGWAAAPGAVVVTTPVTAAH
jgi:hypothetical protein